MDQLMQEIETYASARRILPATVVQAATGHSGTTWAKWKSGATCSVRTAEKLRAYMAANPPQFDPETPSANFARCGVRA